MSHSISQSSAVAEMSMNNADKPMVESPTNEEQKNLSVSQALKKMKKKLRRQGLKQELCPVANGAPQFMLGLAQGRTRPLLHLYDTGCGSVLFKRTARLCIKDQRAL